MTALKVSDVKVVINSSFDEEILSEIEMLRLIRLENYRSMALNPSLGIEKLKGAGLSEELTEIDVISYALQHASEIEDRLKTPHIIHEDELRFYMDTLQ